MLVMALDVDNESPVCLIMVGITLQELDTIVAEGNGVAPMVDIADVLYRIGLPKPAGAVQIIFGATNEAIEEQIRIAMPQMDVFDLGNLGEDADRVAARIREMRARHGSPDDRAAAGAIRSNLPNLN